MSTKDYEVIAQVLHNAAIGPSAREEVVGRLSAAFAERNPRFDPEKFRAIATPEGA